MNLRRFLAVVLATVFIAAFGLSAQTLTTGDITGTVTDATGAVVPNAPISARNVGTGAVVNTTTNSTGSFRFSLLRPGNYMIVVEMSGFAKVEQSASVDVGQATVANISLSLKKSEQTIEVTGTAPVISTNASENTTYSQMEVQELPNAGGDITNIAQTAPGVVVNNMMGYGNFTVNGMPATSNLFTVNGENDMDPYFNINNSGATNLTLGQNEVQEATVISNPYDVQYGQLAGAQVSYVTRSGSNQFHGNADWYWNGRYMNSNDWMANDSGASRPFANANQWAAGVGGPIIKDHTFFFVDTEGLRFVLPNVDDVTIPTPAFQSAVLANVASLEPNETAAYTSMFNLYNNVPNVQNAVAQPIGAGTTCTDNLGTNGLPGFDATSQACAESFVTTPVALASEWIIAGRLDQKIGNKDNIFFRWKTDHGLQPTTLDPVSSNFDALSNQPAYDAQLNETHTFGPNMSNAFTASLSHYVAQFTQSQPLASNTFPFEVTMESQLPFSGFNPMVSFPQGRNITQYQFIDDLTWTRGHHSFHFGENFRRYDVSDHNFFFNYPRAVFTGLQSFVDGLALELEQSDNLKSNVPVALWGIGGYVQDDWSVASNFKLTLGLRIERSSNPVCQIDCFANFIGPAAGVPSFVAAAAGNDPTVVPYNAADSGDIASGLHASYHGVDAVNWSPRVGFSWSPKRFNNSLVVSGGFGLFPDSPAAGLVDDLLGDPPNSVLLRVKNVAAGGVPVFDTTSPNNPSATFLASGAAFNSGFTSGQSFSQISTTLGDQGVVFEPPSFTSLNGTIHAPLYLEWNFQVQKQFGSSTAFQVNYVGNHGERILYTNSWINAFDSNYGFFYPNPNCSSSSCGLPPVIDLPNGLYNGLLPPSSPVPNYANVNQVQNGGISNYDGVTFTIRHQFAHWITGHLNYTYSHNLDDVSNGGLFTYGDGIQSQICPTSLRLCDYGNSDYDIRHLINGDFVVNPTFHVESSFLKQVVNGWQWGNKFIWRTGLPFQVVDNNFNGSILDGGSTILAQPIAGVAGQTSCGEGNASPFGSATPCLNANAFVNSFPYGTNTTFTGYTSFSSQVRNQYRGPHYFDMDMALFKTFDIREKMKIGVGAQAFNVFNHPNFGLPDGGLGDSTFGQISGMTGTPTSPYGNFLGFDSSVRVVQLSAKLQF
jgi:hypothetical protein